MRTVLLVIRLFGLLLSLVGVCIMCGLIGHLLLRSQSAKACDNADVVADGLVDQQDALSVIACIASAACDADVNGDGVTNVSDAQYVVNRYGLTCPSTPACHTWNTPSDEVLSVSGWDIGVLGGAHGSAGFWVWPDDGPGFPTGPVSLSDEFPVIQLAKVGKPNVWIRLMAATCPAGLCAITACAADQPAVIYALPPSL